MTWLLSQNPPQFSKSIKPKNEVIIKLLSSYMYNGIYLCAMHDSGSAYAWVLHECCSTVERQLNGSQHCCHDSQLLAVVVCLQLPLLEDCPYTASRLAGDGRAGVAVVNPYWTESRYDHFFLDNRHVLVEIWPRVGKFSSCKQSKC